MGSQVHVLSLIFMVYISMPGLVFRPQSKFYHPPSSNIYLCDALAGSVDSHVDNLSPVRRENRGMLARISVTALDCSC